MIETVVSKPLGNIHAETLMFADQFNVEGGLLKF